MTLCNCNTVLTHTHSHAYSSATVKRSPFNFSSLYIIVSFGFLFVPSCFFIKSFPIIQSHHSGTQSHQQKIIVNNGEYARIKKKKYYVRILTANCQMLSLCMFVQCTRVYQKISATALVICQQCRYMCTGKWMRMISNWQARSTYVNMKLSVQLYAINDAKSSV